MTLTPRPHQSELVDAIRAELALQDGHKSVLAVLPTGGGKTFVAYMVACGASSKGNRLVILCHRKVLVRQTVEKFREYGLKDIGVVMAGHPLDGTHTRAVVVCSSQSLGRRPHIVKYLNETASLVFADEAHRGEHDTILDAMPKPTRIGLTATPWRTAGNGLGQYYRAAVYGATIKELIGIGLLAPPRVFSHPLIDRSKLAVSGDDYALRAIDAAMNRAVLIGEVFDHWKRHADGRKTVVFAASVDHAKEIAALFSKNGVPANYISSTTMDSDDAHARIAAFRRGEFLVLANFGILCEGFDDPEVSCIIDCRATKSLALAYQMWGRGLRPYPGKDHCVIMDHAGNWSGPFEGDYFRFRPAKLTKRKPKLDRNAPLPPVYQCTACEAILESWPETCPHCGADLRDIPAVDTTRKLEEVSQLTGDAPPPKPPDFPHHQLAKLVKVARHKNLPAGWVMKRMADHGHPVPDKYLHQIGACKNLHGGYEWQPRNDTQFIDGLAPSSLRG